MKYTTKQSNQVDCTHEQLVLLEEWLRDSLKDFPEDTLYQSLYVKVSEALGRNRSEAEAEVKEWETEAKRDAAYEAEVRRLREKYYPEEKAA